MLKMADDDEIDILGDFTFNSCFAQNSQGIPSCSDREDTVHPQWLLDSTATNWYDSRKKEGPLRKLSGNSSVNNRMESRTIWSKNERDLLVKEMSKYGRNVKKISQSFKSKTEAEILALIEAEFGVYLDNPSVEIVREEIHDDVPAVGQEEIISDEVPSEDPSILVQTGSPTIKLPPKPFRRQTFNPKSKNSLLKPDLFTRAEKKELVAINPSDILYEDDLVVGSTESVGSELDAMDTISRKIANAKDKAKTGRKLGNHRRKTSKSDKGITRHSSKDKLKSPLGRPRKNSSLSESDIAKSPKLQIVLGSGQALPISEGEQVIKIAKKESDSESDIDIDTNSDVEDGGSKTNIAKVTQKTPEKPSKAEEPIAVPLRKFEPMPKRQKKFNLDGDGGVTIMHTSAGDLYSQGAEPRRERVKKQNVQLLPCRYYGRERPAPCKVFMNVSTLILMDAHAHTSRAEVMGLVGGDAGGGGGGGTAGGGGGAGGAGEVRVNLTAYRAAAAAAGHTHCDMDPVSQAAAAASLHSLGARVLCWHHSHPCFPAAPSALDLRSQASLQAALDHHQAPFLGLITSQHHTNTGRNASQYRCIRVEHEAGEPVGYQLSVKLVSDLTAVNLHAFLRELRGVLLAGGGDEFSVDLKNDVCPQAKITYLEKCISSISHHMRSAGYEDNDILFKQLIQGVRDVFR